MTGRQDAVKEAVMQKGMYLMWTLRYVYEFIQTRFASPRSNNAWGRCRTPSAKVERWEEVEATRAAQTVSSDIR